MTLLACNPIALALGAAFFAPLASTAPTNDDDARQKSSETTSLSHKQLKDWNIILPNERWTSVEGAILIAGQAEGFLTERTGELKLEVDTNADGQLDAVVRGSSGVLKLRGRTEDGRRFTYAVRFQGASSGWKFASGGVMSGKLNGVTVRFIDQNNNGIWNEVGVDAMTVGASKGASFLSSKLSLGGELFELELTADGTQATITPWKGESGVLNLVGDFTCRGKLVSAVVNGEGTSFNLASARGGLRIPVGRYEFVFGYAVKGEESVEISVGRMTPLMVSADTKRKIEWGGPIAAEVTYRRSRDTLTVDKGLRYFGSAGEEYTRFQPDAKSPKIMIRDAKTGKLIDSGRFAGC